MRLEEVLGYWDGCTFRVPGCPQDEITLDREVHEIDCNTTVYICWDENGTPRYDTEPTQTNYGPIIDPDNCIREEIAVLDNTVRCPDEGTPKERCNISDDFPNCTVQYCYFRSTQQSIIISASGCEDYSSGQVIPGDIDHSFNNINCNDCIDSCEEPFPSNNCDNCECEAGIVSVGSNVLRNTESSCDYEEEVLEFQLKILKDFECVEDFKVSVTLALGDIDDIHSEIDHDVFYNVKEDDIFIIEDRFHFAHLCSSRLDLRFQILDEVNNVVHEVEFKNQFTFEYDNCNDFKVTKIDGPCPCFEFEWELPCLGGTGTQSPADGTPATFVADDFEVLSTHALAPNAGCGHTGPYNANTLTFTYNGETAEPFSFPAGNCTEANLDDPTGCDKDLSSSKPNEAHDIAFSQVLPYGETPVMMLGPLSGNDPAAASARISNVRHGSFDLSIAEWGPNDGLHSEETVSYQYAPTGNYDLGGIESEFKNVTNVTEAYQWVYFDQPFDQTPVVNVTILSDNNQQAVTARVTSVSKTRFRVKLQQEEVATTALNPEMISYMAFSTGQGSIGNRQIAVGRTPQNVNHNWITVDFTASNALGSSYIPIENPQFFAFMQTNTGDETAVLRYRNLTSTSVELMVQEELSKDSETNHGTEIIGYVLMESGEDCCHGDEISLHEYRSYNVTCLWEDGSIIGNAEGNNPPFTYEWDNGETTSSIDGLSSGRYTLTVTDYLGCTAEQSFDISRSSRLGLEYSAYSHPSCFEDDGSITLFVYGGIPPYTYEWSNGETTKDLVDLSPGNYRVTVTSSTGCKGVRDFELYDLEIDDTYKKYNPTCGADNGTIVGGAVGGSSPFSYAWSDGHSTSSRYDLEEGTYQLTVTDSDGCTRTKSFYLSNDNTLHLSSTGGNEGFTEGRFIEGGTSIDWRFNPLQVTDQLIITSSVDGILLNTGYTSVNSSCQCNYDAICSCTTLFLGDYPNAQVPLIVGDGTAGNTIDQCDYGSDVKQVTDVFGTITIPSDAYITIEVIGRNCGVGNTIWYLDLDCDNSKSLQAKLEEWRKAEKHKFDYEAEQLTSIDEVENTRAVSVFPNPAKSWVNIKSNSLTARFDANLLDLNGKRLKSIEDVKGGCRINLQDLPQGVYIVSVSFEDNSRVVKKLIVK